MKTISPLHYIVTRPEQAETACRAGADWVQLRVKAQSYTNWKAIALDTLAVCRQYNARLIINDNPQLAGEVGAHGVHLGQDDMPIQEARVLLGDRFIIGGTANTLETILAHQHDGVDYVGLGPFRFTTTKEKLSPILGSRRLPAHTVRPETPVGFSTHHCYWRHYAGGYSGPAANGGTWCGGFVGHNGRSGPGCPNAFVPDSTQPYVY